MSIAVDIVAAIAGPLLRIGEFAMPPNRTPIIKAAALAGEVSRLIPNRIGGSR
jgi:hypothetical protein